MLISGFAMGFVFVPLTTMSMATLPQDQIGNASGIYNLMRNTGGSIGIAIMTTLLARNQQVHQSCSDGTHYRVRPGVSAAISQQIKAGLMATMRPCYRDAAGLCRLFTGWSYSRRWCLHISTISGLLAILVRACVFRQAFSSNVSATPNRSKALIERCPRRLFTTSSRKIKAAL